MVKNNKMLTAWLDAHIYHINATATLHSLDTAYTQALEMLNRFRTSSHLSEEEYVYFLEEYKMAKSVGLLRVADVPK